MTVSTTVNVAGRLYWWFTVTPVPFVPSPKSHSQRTIVVLPAEPDPGDERPPSNVTVVPTVVGDCEMVKTAFGVVLAAVTVTDADVEEFIAKLREQRSRYEKTEEAAAKVCPLPSSITCA